MKNREKEKKENKLEINIDVVCTYFGLHNHAQTRTRKHMIYDNKVRTIEKMKQKN